LQWIECIKKAFASRASGNFSIVAVALAATKFSWFCIGIISAKHNYHANDIAFVYTA